MQHTRQAPGRDIHKHFSLAPTRSHKITASNKASATAATRNPPPLPDPYKTGPKLAKRRRGLHTCHSTLSLPPTHPPSPLARPHTPPHLEPRTGTDGEGRRDSARLCVAVVRCQAFGLAASKPPPPLIGEGEGRHTAAGGKGVPSPHQLSDIARPIPRLSHTLLPGACVMSGGPVPSAGLAGVP